MVARNKKPLLFDNLLTLDELLSEVLRGQYTASAVRKWIQEGMPKQTIARKLWFDPHKVSQWLQDHKGG